MRERIVEELGRKGEKKHNYAKSQTACPTRTAGTGPGVEQHGKGAAGQRGKDGNNNERQGKDAAMTQK